MTPERIAELRALAGADVWMTNASPLVDELLDEIERLRSAVEDIRDDIEFANAHAGMGCELPHDLRVSPRTRRALVDRLDDALRGSE